MPSNACVIYTDCEHPTAPPGIGPADAVYAVITACPSARTEDHNPIDPPVRMVLKLAGFPTDKAYYTVLEKFLADTKPTRDKLTHAVSMLALELALFPRLQRVLVLGTDAARVLAPGFKDMLEDHGTLFYNPTLKLRVVPTFSYDLLQKDPTVRPLFYRDIERCVTIPDPEPPVVVEVTPEFLERIPEHAMLSLDIETTGTAWDDVITQIGLSWEPNVVAVAQNPSKDFIHTLLHTLRAKHVTLIGSFLQFDLARLYRDAGSVVLFPTYDTTVMARIHGEQYLSLKHLSAMYTNRPGPRSYGSWEHEDVLYLAEDVLSAAAVAQELVHTTRAPIWPVLSRLVPAFAAMQYYGVFLDIHALDHVRSRILQVLETHKQRLESFARINWNSNEQVVHWLRAQGVKFRQKTKTADQYRLDDRVLESLSDQHEAIRILRQYRDAKKVSEFVVKYTELTTPTHPFVHPTIKLDGTRTGRLSATEPNIQQVKNSSADEREAGLSIKQIFRSRWDGGMILQIDLSQIELRILALFSGDTAMAKALEGDIHTETAVAVLGLDPSQITKQHRTLAKRANFGEVYGIGALTLARQCGVDLETAQAFQNGFRTRFPTARAWIEQTGTNAVKTGYVETPFGRKRFLTDPIRYGADNSPSGVWRKGVNTPIQATASDVMLVILDVFIQEKRRTRFRSLPLFPVHDALVIDVYPGETDTVIDALQHGFHALHATPLATFPLWGDALPIIGEYVIGDTWEDAEVNPIRKGRLST